MAETRNIVVLGASVGGLSAGHYLAKHVLPQLQGNKDAKYELHIVDQSTHFWWHIAAPREIVSVKDAKHEDYFIPIMDGFKQYTSLKDSIHFHHATAKSLDTAARTVTVEAEDGTSQTIPYYSLILATGTKTPTPATTLHGPHTLSQKALEDFNTRLASAKEIVLGGGGPIGVESAGEIGYRYGSKAKITLVAGSTRLLPILSEARAKKAETLLNKVGVKVIYGTKITETSTTSDGKTEITLDNGEKLSADVYIPTSGVKPSTEFLPSDLLTERGYVKTNKSTLRVEGAGERVYAVGDVNGVDKGGVLNFYNSFPIAAGNIGHDLLGSKAADKKYVFKDPESQFVPVGPKTGVAAFNGWSVPGFMVSLAKGKDYLKASIPDFTEGKKWTKAY